MASNALKTLFTNIASAIRETLPDEPSMKPYDYPDKIREVASIGGGDGGDLVRYVTIMSEDGSKELYKKPTIKGDDCVNVVSKGLMSKPTKESTNTTNYTFSGYALKPNSPADSNALKNITQDTVLYISFSSSVRYYKVNFYDDEADTTPTSFDVTYGSDASSLYTPKKNGYRFNGWNVNVSNIKSDIDVIGQWSIDDGIIRDSWETVSNNAQNYKVGDRKEVSLTYSSGITETVYFRVIGKNVEKTPDGKIGVLTFMPDNLIYNLVKPANSLAGGNVIFELNTNVATALNEIMNALPSELQNVLVEVYKKEVFGRDKRKLFIPSLKHLKTNTGDVSDTYPTSIYEYFANGNTVKRTKLNDESADNYWTSYNCRSTSATKFFSVYDGTTLREDNVTAVHYLLPCFCVGVKDA